MNNKIEDLARVIWTARRHGSDKDTPWHMVPERQKRFFRDIAFNDLRSPAKDGVVSIEQGPLTPATEHSS